MGLGRPFFLAAQAVAEQSRPAPATNPAPAVEEAVRWPPTHPGDSDTSEPTAKTIPRDRRTGLHELRTGRVIEHRPGRTVTETDNLLMIALTGNAAPIHIDAHYSGRTEWGRPLVCGIVTLGIVAGMSVRSTSGLTVANLSVTDITFERPVFIGDTLYAETEILDTRAGTAARTTASSPPAPPA